MAQNSFDEILRVDKTSISQKKVFPKRKSRIDEAISWPHGTEKKPTFYTLWDKFDYRISLGKPGKEAFKSYPGMANPNDMKPTIFFKNKNLDKSATFQEIVKNLEIVSNNHSYALELLGCLLFRSAFLLDHSKIDTNEPIEIYRYTPNELVIKRISKDVPHIYDIPVEVFLHYLNAIALNEDVKYSTRGYDLSSKNAGGKNNLLTYVNLIAVLSGKKPLYTLSGPLLMSGVSAISLQDAFNALPHLVN